MPTSEPMYAQSCFCCVSTSVCLALCTILANFPVYGKCSFAVGEPILPYVKEHSVIFPQLQDVTRAQLVRMAPSVLSMLARRISLGLSQQTFLGQTVDTRDPLYVNLYAKLYQ